MFDTILNLFAPYVLGALALIAGFFGWRSSRNKKAAEEAVQEAMLHKQRADSMDAATKAHEDAQEAARGVPKPRPADPVKRGGLRGQR